VFYGCAIFKKLVCQWVNYSHMETQNPDQKACIVL